MNPHAEHVLPIPPYAAMLRDKRRTSPRASSLAEWLAVVQGLYYCFRGLWPLLSPTSFVALAGPQTDWWGIYASSAVLGVIGIVFLAAALRSALSLEVGLLMIGCSFSLGLLDAIFIVHRGLNPFYMVDGIEEAVVLILSLLSLQHFTHRRHSTFL